MNRRSMLIAASAGLVVPSLLATAASAQTEAKKVSGDYEEKTLKIGSFSKAISQMAEQKAKKKPIKEFAVYETAEQTAVAEALTDERDPKPPAFTAEQQEMVEKLGKETGDNFDKAYIKGEIHGHEQVRKIQEAYLDAHGMKSDHGHIALLAKMVIDMHLDMLHGLQTQFG